MGPLRENKILTWMDIFFFFKTVWEQPGEGTQVVWCNKALIAMFTASYIYTGLTLQAPTLEGCTGTTMNKANLTDFRAVTGLVILPISDPNHPFWKTIGNLFHAPRSYGCHFVDICEFKLQLPTGNAPIGDKSSVFTWGFLAYGYCHHLGPCVSVCVSTLLVRPIIHCIFQLESPNLDQKM